MSRVGIACVWICILWYYVGGCVCRVRIVWLLLFSSRSLTTEAHSCHNAWGDFIHAHTRIDWFACCSNCELCWWRPPGTEDRWWLWLRSSCVCPTNERAWLSIHTHTRTADTRQTRHTITENTQASTEYTLFNRVPPSFALIDANGMPVNETNPKWASSRQPGRCRRFFRLVAPGINEGQGHRAQRDDRRVSDFRHVLLLRPRWRRTALPLGKNKM